jgi:hypothetical protein
MRPARRRGTRPVDGVDSSLLKAILSLRQRRARGSSQRTSRSQELIPARDIEYPIQQRIQLIDVVDRLDLRAHVLAGLT